MFEVGRRGWLGAGWSCGWWRGSFSFMKASSSVSSTGMCCEEFMSEDSSMPRAWRGRVAKGRRKTLSRNCFGMQAYRVRGGRKRMLAGGVVEVEVFIGGGGGGEVKIAHYRSRSSLLYRII